MDRPYIYDCFPVNGEMDLVEMRFKELFNTVDRFIVTEGNKSFDGKDKPFYFLQNLFRFEKYLSKVTHLMITEWPDLDARHMDPYQKDYCRKYLTHCKDNDVIILGDCDEIASVEAIQSYRPEMGIMSLQQDFYYFNMNVKSERPWLNAKIVPYHVLKQMSVWDVRYGPIDGVIPNGGKHLSYFGSVEDIIKKIEQSFHQEFNTDYWKNAERIKKCIADGVDLFERPTEKFYKVDKTK